MTQKTLDVTITSRVMRQSVMFLHSLAMAYAGKSIVIVCVTDDEARQSLEYITQLFYKHAWQHVRLDEKSDDTLTFSSGGKVTVHVPRVRPEPDLPMAFVDEFGTIMDADVQRLIEMDAKGVDDDDNVIRVWRNGFE